MIDLEKAARQALEALEDYKRSDDDRVSIAMHTLRCALEHPSNVKQVIELYDSPERPAQQEPVAAECKFDREEKWVRCEIAHHNLVQSEPHKWPGYQTRLLYTRPQAREWVGLTDEEIIDHFRTNVGTGSLLSFADGVRYAEAKLREKNT